MPDTPDPEDLRDTSDQLLEAVERLKELETEKRMRQISTPEFHVLADEVALQARNVFRVAEREERMGDEMPTQDATIEEAEPGD